MGVCWQVWQVWGRAGLGTQIMEGNPHPGYWLVQWEKWRSGLLSEVPRCHSTHMDLGPRGLESLWDQNAHTAVWGPKGLLAQRRVDLEEVLTAF